MKAQGLRQGELWARANGTVTDLAVSPDGTRLLASLERPEHSGLRVWALSPRPRAARPRAGAPDPLNEVADAPAEFQLPKLQASLPALDGQVPQQAQWVDADTVLFQLKHPDREGSLQRRPALWHLGGAVDTAPAPVPAPRWKTLAPIHRQGAWVLELDGQTVPLPGQAAGRAFVDEPRQQIFAACELEGIWNLVRVPYRREAGVLAFQTAQRLTRTVSAAWNPAPSPDGKWLYFTSLDARGSEIRRLDLGLPPMATASAAEPRLLTRSAVMPPAPAAAPDSLPRVAPPPAQPYRAWDNLDSHLAFAGLWTPAGRGFQLGGAGADLLGRLSWQALAGFGDGAGPRGASFGAASAAWPWKPSLTLFSALERPSLQASAPVDRDQQRRGLEFALAYQDLAGPMLWTSPVLAWERDQQLPQAGSGPVLTRSLAGLRSRLQSQWGRGQWLLTLAPALDLYAGSSDSALTGQSQPWTATRAAFSVRLATPISSFTLKGAEGRLGGNSSESFHLGGVTTSLVPASLDLTRLEQPALPAYSAEGGCFRQYRVQLGDSLRAYLEGAALWNPGQVRPAFQRVFGLEFALDFEGSVRDPVSQKLSLRLGLHRPLDGVMAGRNVASLSLVIRP